MLEAQIWPGSKERYTVTPSELHLGPSESIAVTIQLRVLCYAAKKKAQEQGQRDNFRIKANLGSPICLYIYKK